MHHYRRGTVRCLSLAALAYAWVQANWVRLAVMALLTQPDPPQRLPRWARGVLAAAAVVGVGGAALLAWLPSDEALAQRVADAATERLGVKVAVGALHWQLWPTPQVVLNDVATDQPAPVQLRQVTLTPRLGSLLRGPLALERVEVDGATVPQLSLRGLGQGGTGAGDVGALPDAQSAATPLARLQFRDVTWVSRTGIAVDYAGEADFDPAWRPRSAQIRRPGFTPATTLTLTRLGTQDRWRTEITLGGGTADGEVALNTADDGMLRLEGQLKPQAVEVASAVAAFNRRSPVAGKASGTTTLSAQGPGVGALAQSLQTRSTLHMAPATVLRFDLNKVVRTLGRDPAGSTTLNSLSGQMETQNTPDGMVTRFTGLQARSGILGLSGEATLANRQIDATLAIDLVDGLVGVPLRVQGPVQAPTVSVSGGTVAGAVAGTAVLPGIGTALGARIGATLGKIFGDGAPAATPSAPKTPPRAGPADDPLWRGGQ